MFDTGWVDREPVEYPPDTWRGELAGLHIKHVGDIPVTVRCHGPTAARAKSRPG
jgi:hypothetical protein